MELFEKSLSKDVLNRLSRIIRSNSLDDFVCQGGELIEIYKQLFSVIKRLREVKSPCYCTIPSNTRIDGSCLCKQLKTDIYLLTRCIEMYVESVNNTEED